jgi:threonine-phosphate decarboxylase
VLDFSANINPYQAVDLSCLQHVALGPYSDPEYRQLKQSIKQRYPLPTGVDIEVFNGASAAIFALLRWLQPHDLVLYAPLYVEYAQIAESLGGNVQTLNRFSDNLLDVPKGSTVVFVNPSTPDGRLYALHDLLTYWQAANCTIIIDESFLDFCKADSVSDHIARYDKLFIIKSLSKFYGCAGIRIGFIMAASAAIQALKRLEPAWKLSSLDMAYMQQALANTDFIAQTRVQTETLRALLQQALEASGLFAEIYPGQANFLLTRLKNNGDGYALQQQLMADRILIRVCDNFAGLNNSYVRFAVKDAQAIQQLARALSKIV